MRRKLFAGSCWMLLALGAIAEPVVHTVSRATSPIEIDGVLDEPAWDDAARVELAYEVEPGDNVTPPVRTICLIAYDENFVYFGFDAQDPDPSQIRARYSDRDQAWSDDWVGVVLDTFNDERRAYELFSTPLGVQIDALNNDVSQIYDPSWNAIWDSAGRITETGYEVEMAIPFHQIRFQRVDGEQVWGFDANRSYPRDFRHHMSVFARERGSNSYLSQTIKIRGMEGASPGRNLEFIPTVTAGRTDARADLADEDLAAGDVDADVGLSVRWGVTPNISLNGAANPDFSQVEADALQLSENEQFALFFPETRPFFLEGADYFTNDLQLVHTRAIVDPSAAGKLTGKQGRHTWALFSTRDAVTNLIVPGIERSSGGQFDLDNTSSAARYRLDFGANSFVGGTVTDRRASGGYRNSVFSADTVYRISDSDKVNATVAFSTTEYSDQMVADLGVQGGTLSDPAINLSYNHGERGWWVYAEGNQRGKDYRSDLGFMPNVGLRSAYVGGAKVWWGEEGDTVQRNAWGASYSRADPVDGGMQRERYDTWLNANLPRETYVYGDASIGRERFDARMYDVWNAGAGFNSQLTGNLFLSAEARGGDWIDFANGRGGQRRFLQSSVGYTFGRHLKLSLGHILSAMDVSGERLFTVHAPQLRAVQQFNARTFVRLVLQYTNVRRDPLLYDDPVDEETQSLLTQLLFSYKVNPQTALYAGYGDNQFGDDQYDLTRTDRTFFLKIGYAWVQ